MTIEKRKRPLTTFALFGEDVGEENPLLKARREKIWANLKARHEQLRRDLEKKGMIPKGK